MILKQYKIITQLYNLFNKKYLKHNIPLFKKYGLDKKYYSSISSQDFKGLQEDLNIYDVNNSKDLLHKDPNFMRLETHIQKAILNWSDNGYAIIRSFFSREEVDTINNEIEDLIDTGKLKITYDKSRYMFANRLSKFIDNLAKHRMQPILEVLLKKKITLFQTINFKTGSEQSTHSDSIHMTTFPKGNLIAVWVALQDITVEDGPLHYYPGSHKLDYIMNEDYDNSGTRYKLGNKTYSNYGEKIQEVIDSSKIERKQFLAKAGDILIWHANLLHGGDKINVEGNTRKSMVFHYYADDVICYHEITQRPTLKGKLNHN